MATNLFDRLNPDGSVSLDGRTESLGGGTDVAGYALTLAIAPVEFELGKSAVVTVRARQDGVPIVDQVIDLASDNGSVIAVASTVTTYTDGNSVFSIVGATVGSATISASMTIDGTVYNATSIEVTVTTPDAPENYDATGYGRVSMTIESPIANAMVPRVERLSHAEQSRLYPGDTGLSRLAKYENATIVFVPKELQS